MESTTVAALGSGAAALLVAIVSLITAVLTNRASGRTQRELATMKNEFSSSQSARAIVDAEVEASLDGLTRALRSIQKLKDEVQLVLAAVSGRLSAQTALQSLEATRSGLFSVYEEVYPHLSDREKRACHRAKNAAAYVTSVAHRAMGDGRDPASMPNEHRERLLDLRSELTDCQNLLRDSRTDRLVHLAVGTNSAGV